MYVLVSKVGCNYGILDTNDGALDWVDQSTVQAVLNRGISIAGVTPSGIVPQDYNLQSTLCNWNNGQNIFQIGRGLVISKKGEFKFIAGKKTYKGKVISVNNGVYTLRFNFGVVTQVNASVLNTMNNR